jgi:lipopolysaccharide/colanic/teichoic acid biosynthesis glycosyltransferase
MSAIKNVVKYVFDILCVILFAPLLLPLGSVLALLVRITSGSPVFFRQERAGINCKPFIMHKLRTMRTGCDPFGPSPKTGYDSRLTRLGKWLRQTSLDELPQFWNVLKGEMSIVGPRPLYMEQVQHWTSHQRQRLLVKPGLTGLAQVSGRGNLTLEDKLELDVQYVKRQSLLLDAQILLKTFVQLFRSREVYEKRYSQTEETRSA